MSFMDSVRGHSTTLSYDEGLRSYMLRVYNYMASALGVSGAVALIVAFTPSLLQLFSTPILQFLVVIAPVILAVTMSARVNTMSVSATHACFWSFAVLMGISLSYLFVVYTGMSVARVFFISASVFGTMSLYGYSTKKDLTSMGSFMVMGLMGIIVASLFNLFLKSSALFFATSVLGVIIFVGLTAYDVQRIKGVYYTYGLEGSDSATSSKVSIMGALTLYLDFINLFVSLMHLFGERR